MAKLPFLLTIEFKTKKYSPYYPKAFNHIGDHIKAARLEKGLLKKDVAKLIGVDPITITHWELKLNKRIHLKHWPNIIQLLGYCPYPPCNSFYEKERCAES